MLPAAEVHELARHAVANANTFAHLHHGQEVAALGALASACYVLLALNVGPLKAREIVLDMTEGNCDAASETGEGREDGAEDLRTTE